MKEFTRKFLIFAVSLLLSSFCFGIQTRAETPTIKPTVLNDFKDENTQVATYRITIPAGQDKMAVPVTMPIQGMICFEYESDNAEDGLNLYLYPTKDGTTRFHTYSFANHPGFFSCLEAQTCYLKIFRYDSEYYGNKEITITIKSYCYDLACDTRDVKLKNGQWVMSCGYDIWGTYDLPADFDGPITSTLPTDPADGCGCYRYYEIVVPKRGYIQLDAELMDAMKRNQQYNSIHYILCNNKKKELELTGWGFGSSYKNDIFNNIAVEKGTYYLKVTNSGEFDMYKLKYTFKSNPNKKNYTKKNAVNLKSGKAVCNAFYSKDKKSTWTRWYKIKVPKKKKLAINIECLSTYSIMPYCYTTAARTDWEWGVYDTKGNRVKTIADKGVSYTAKKIKAGTYYIKLYTPGWNFKTKKRTMGDICSFTWR